MEAILKPRDGILFAINYFPLLNDNASYINVKIKSADLPGTRARIEKAWKRIDTIHPLDATFYSDQIERSYSEYSAMLKIIGFMAFLAIIITSMGLLGMVVFSTETRLKEVGIRKVMGAGVGNLVYLLSKGFLILLIISSLIALPLTYVLFDKVILTKMIHEPFCRYPFDHKRLFMTLNSSLLWKVEQFI